MQAWILRRLIAHSTFALVVKNQISSNNLYSRAYSVTIGFGSDKEYLQPVIRIPAIVAQQLRSLPVVVYQDVQIAIVIEVTDRRTATDSRQDKIRPELIADVLKDAAAGVAEHELRLGILRVCVIALDIIEHVTVRHKQVTRSVIVVIKKSRPETAHMKSCVREFRAEGRVIE